MSKKQPSTRTDALQRARTLIALNASKAALEAYRKVIDGQIRDALQMLDDLEPYASGNGDLPPTALKMGDAFRRRDAALASNPPDAAGEEQANAELCELLGDLSLMDLCSSAVEETYRQATVPSTDITETLREIGRAVFDPFEGGTPQACHEAFELAAYGRSRTLQRRYQEVARA
jgi:hypothetical protein